MSQIVFGQQDRYNACTCKDNPRWTRMHTIREGIKFFLRTEQEERVFPIQEMGERRVTKEFLIKKVDWSRHWVQVCGQDLTGRMEGKGLSRKQCTMNNGMEAGKWKGGTGQMHWQGAYQRVMTRFVISRYLNSRKIKNPILFNFNKEGVLLITR